MLWSGPTAGGVTVPTSLPVPTTGYTSLSAITSAGLNGNGLAAPLAFLNNVPQLRTSDALSTSVSSTASLTATLVPIATATIDNWSKFSAVTHLWTAPVSGVYLVHGCVSYGINNSASGAVAAGVRINGSINIWGPPGPTLNTSGLAIVQRPQVVRLLDLQAGDTVGLITSQNTGSAATLSSGAPCRLVIRWMSSLAGSNGAFSSLVPPVSGFRFQAGTPGGQLVSQFNTHLGNDLSFLLQRPYLLAYQTAAQTGLASGAFSGIQMGNLGGRIHNSAGDSFSGWANAGQPFNQYNAIVPGWYLVVATYNQAVNTSTTGNVAAVGYFQSGGTAQGSVAQAWGQQSAPPQSGYDSGAEAIALLYLRAGDFVNPQFRSSGATWATSVATAGQESSFGCVWVSE